MRSLILLATVSVLASSAVFAELPTTLVYESFNTQTRCDLDSTTAFWDTAEGKLHLHPYAITEVGGYDGSGTSYHLAVAGDVVYVADGAAGLRLIDVTDPATPSLVSTLNTPGSAYGVALRGDHAYVADNDHGLQVVDVTNPVLPMLAGGVGLGGLSARGRAENASGSQAASLRSTVASGGRRSGASPASPNASRSSS